MYDWSDIRVFLAVLRTGSAAAAARALATNQTTVSRRLARLEAALGLHLFEPGPRGAHPTEAALRLRSEAEALEAAAEALRLRADDLGRRVGGVIRVTVNPLVMRYAAGLLPRFQALHPGTELRVDTDPRVLSLEAGEADVALRAAVRLEGDALIARKLLSHPWGFYASKDYVARNGRPSGFADLAGHRVVCCSGPEAAQEPIRSAQARLPVHDHPIRIQSLSGVVGMLRAGEGVGLLARAEGDVLPELTFCFTEPDLVQGLWLVTTREGQDDPTIRAFTRFCADALPSLLKALPPEWRA